ncbi:MAG TPA: heme-binding protein [Gemmatimonadales bacterium]|nr:heme-binding protein [Gemmatimonadales bacterium]
MATRTAKHPVAQQETITLDDARRVIAAGEDKARQVGQPENIAVVDAGGNLLAYHRMDGAWIGSIDISIDKAFTSRAFNLPTKALAKKAEPGGPFYGIQNSNGGRVMIFAGGVPLKRDGQIVGAVGVSGGSGDQDEEVAEAAAAAL